MDRQKILAYYLNLKESSDLTLVFPKATGEWEKDEKEFTKYYKENIKLIQEFENLDTFTEEDDFPLF